MKNFINPRPPYPNELFHHGIKGQQWGIRNGPPYPLGSGKVTNNKTISWLDKTYNLDRWGKSPNTNCLYITGHSGSGKSTLATKLSKNAIYIELDHYLDNPYYGTGNKQFDKYLLKNNPNWVNIQKNYKKWDDKIFIYKDASQKERDYFWNARDKILTKDIPKFSRQMYGKSKVIAEGIQIYSSEDWGGGDNGKFVQKQILSGKPIIIKGTTKTISSFRGVIRDAKEAKYNGEPITAKDVFNMTYNRVLSKQSFNDRKNLSDFKKQFK